MRFARPLVAFETLQRHRKKPEGRPTIGAVARRKLEHRVSTLIGRSPMRWILWIEGEASGEERVGHDVPQAPKLSAARWVLRDDLEVDVLRHPPDQSVRATE